MKRRLIVMRHAKSSWDTDAPSDHARPLNPRGQRDAPRIANRLLELDWRPQLVLSSDSRRTQQTFDAMRPVLGEDVPVQFLPSLYAAGLTELAAALAAVDDGLTCVLALGHNPGWEEAVRWLCGQPVRLTTANAALLVGTGSTWQVALRGAGSWDLDCLLRPKELNRLS
jgi:phosphohistidine phosphatase SixA